MTRGNPLELALPALFNTTDIELTGTFAKYTTGHLFCKSVTNKY